MRFKYLVLLAAVVFILLPAPAAHAQLSFGVQIGGGYPEVPPGPPMCAYGYYSYPPYACAPMGYYGPQWFNGGVFLGAGPWLHRGWGDGDGWRGGGWGGDGWRGGGWRGDGRPGWGGDRGFVGGGFHGGDGGFHGGGFHGGGFHGGGFHGGGRR